MPTNNFAAAHSLYWAAVFWLIGGANLQAASNDWFTRYTVASFRTLAPARAVIRMEALDRDLLDAAVFHETNRRRAQHRLPALAFNLRARSAARMQSAAMAKHAFVSHTNEFEATRRTLTDRARLAGIQPLFLAENVASAFARHYRSGDTVYVRTEAGRKVVSAAPDGPPLGMRSYIEFAEALVESWMNSPGHRKNILHTSAKTLGCANEPAAAQSEIEMFYCTQVFATPRE